MNYKRISKFYNSAVFISFNTILFFIIINLGIYAVILINDKLTVDPVSEKYGKQRLAAVYPHLNEQEMNDLLEETWSRPYAYEPFTQFKERTYHGNFVNIDENGFRVSKNQGPWPPEPQSFNIFIFGGSTTFGYGVEDSQTVASHLQDYLTSKFNRTVRVYNFGRGYYYSTQERILFTQLLTAGYVPDMAIFIDGLNDFYYKEDKPLFTSRFREVMDVEKEIAGLILQLPVVQVARWFKHILENNPENTKLYTIESMYDDPARSDYTIKRYLMNKKLIESTASLYSIQPVFVWQPVPTFKYDNSNHLFVGSGYGGHKNSIYGYKAMAKFKNKNTFGENFLWCADIQQDMKEPLYVDKVHYTAMFSKRFALFVADLLIDRKLLDLQSN